VFTVTNRFTPADVRFSVLPEVVPLTRSHGAPRELTVKLRGLPTAPKSGVTFTICEALAETPAATLKVSWDGVGVMDCPEAAPTRLNRKRTGAIVPDIVRITMFAP
jgi:hypothetical protein